jgi:quercetin dioxygenase-like cupin family protein
MDSPSHSPSVADFAGPFRRGRQKSDAGYWDIFPSGNSPLRRPPGICTRLETGRAAEANKGPRGIVIEAFDKVWLFTAEETGWKGPSGGELHFVIGPLPVASATDYSAQFMEAVFTPGMASAAHVHSGPEAFYTLEGETCLETPAGVQVSQGGGPPVIIPDGPMHLTATGTALRRGFVLILHRTGQPATTRIHDWAPKHLCKARQP